MTPRPYRRREQGVTARWMDAVQNGLRGVAYDHAHDEALREGAQRAAPGLRPMPPMGEGIWAQHLGRPPTGDREDYFPGRPADAPDPDRFHTNPPGIAGERLGANMTDYNSGSGSHAEQARATTQLGTMACDQAINLLAATDEKIGEVLQMFLAAGAGTSQHAMREATELAAAAREKLGEVTSAIVEAKSRAEQAVW